MFESIVVKLRSHLLWLCVLFFFLSFCCFLGHLSVYLFIKSLFGIVVGLFKLACASGLSLKGSISVLLHVFDVVASIYDIFAPDVNSHVHPSKNLAKHHTVLFHLFFIDTFEILFQERHFLVYFVLAITRTHWVVRTNLKEKLLVNQRLCPL